MIIVSLCVLLWKNCSHLSPWILTIVTKHYPFMAFSVFGRGVHPPKYECVSVFVCSVFPRQRVKYNEHSSESSQNRASCFVRWAASFQVARLTATSRKQWGRRLLWKLWHEKGLTEHTCRFGEQRLQGRGRGFNEGRRVCHSMTCAVTFSYRLPPAPQGLRAIFATGAAGSRCVRLHTGERAC